MQRLDYIDQMKGLAILSVVIGHIYLPHTIEGAMHPIASMIYSCHMSFFFFLSGYINQKVNAIETKGRKNFITKKIESILIPYFFAVIISPLFLNNSYPHDLQSLIDRFNFFPIGLYWFLPVLFLFMMLYLIKHEIEKRYNNNFRSELAFNAVSIGIFCISGIIIHQYFIIIYGIYWYAFLLGDFLSKHDRFRSHVTSKMTFGVCALVLCAAWKFYPLEANGVAWKSMTNLILSFICSTTASIVLYNFFLKASIPQWIKKYLQEMGKFSLVIYILPVSFFPQNFIFSENLPFAVLNLIILVIGILNTLTRYTLGRIIYEIPYLRFIMFGKK